MMNALTGSRLNVMGSSSATVRAGPMPGSTPTAVPSVTPPKAQARCGQVSALAKPSASRRIVSIRGSRFSFEWVPSSSVDLLEEFEVAGLERPGEQARRQGQLQHAREQEVGGH